MPWVLITPFLAEKVRLSPSTIGNGCVGATKAVPACGELLATGRFVDAILLGPHLGSELVDFGLDSVDGGPVCSLTEHVFQVFYVGAMGEGSYPTDDAFGTYVTRNCLPAFGAYIGKAYDDSDLAIYWLAPTEPMPSAVW